MNLVLLGPPGSGKGTQAERIAEEFNLKVFSTGNILRQLAKKETPLGRKIKEILRRGELVPDEIMAEILADFLTKEKREGILFDWLPPEFRASENFNFAFGKIRGSKLGYLFESAVGSGGEAFGFKENLPQLRCGL